MPYELTLRDLSMAPAQVGVDLQLHNCREVLVTADMAGPLSFARWIGLGKMIGSCVMTKTPFRDFAEEELLHDLDLRELSASDPMHRIATDYNAHQHMREFVRRTIESLSTFDHEEQVFFERVMTALSAWMMLHDVQVANLHRAQTRRMLKQYGRVLFMVGCSSNRAYARRIGHDRIDMSQAIYTASHSVTSLRIPVKDDWTPGSPTRH